MTLVFGAAIPPVDALPSDAPTEQTLPACSQVPGHVGRMFGRLPGASWAAADLDLLAAKTMAGEKADRTPEGQVDDEGLRRMQDVRGR